MTDKILALVALAALVGSLGILVIFVPEPDLIIVTLIALALAAYDFYLSLFRARTDER